LLGRYGKAYGFDLTAAGLAIGREMGRTRIARASVAAAPASTGYAQPAAPTRFDSVRRDTFWQRLKRIMLGVSTS